MVFSEGRDRMKPSIAAVQAIADGRPNGVRPGTPPDPVDTWPENGKIVVSLCPNSRFPLAEAASRALSHLTTDLSY